ncbi:MAG: hypothetical protein CMH44_05830 [Muricauda sp.]|nr:hypothetical protein [Allomuricauda sp.]
MVKVGHRSIYFKKNGVKVSCLVNSRHGIIPSFAIYLQIKFEGFSSPILEKFQMSFFRPTKRRAYSKLLF